MEESKKKKRESTAKVRKASEKGVVTQKMMAFRIDAENVEKLKEVANKGRLINKLLADFFRSAEEQPG